MPILCSIPNCFRPSADASDYCRMHNGQVEIIMDIDEKLAEIRATIHSVADGDDPWSEITTQELNGILRACDKLAVRIARIPREDTR